MVAVDIGGRLVVTQVARQGLYNDYATLCPPVDAANRRVPVGARVGRRGS